MDDRPIVYTVSPLAAIFALLLFLRYLQRRGERQNALEQVETAIAETLGGGARGDGCD